MGHYEANNYDINMSDYTLSLSRPIKTTKFFSCLISNRASYKSYRDSYGRDKALSRDFVQYRSTGNCTDA